MSDKSLETPDGDAAEQNAEAFPESDDDAEAEEAAEAQEPPLEADEGDAAEQERTVAVDDDEYR
ncbi:MAG: hypothetical protein WAK71_21945 [Streptosporangiaceae bacterium]|jgi:hypothetical protein